MDTNREGEDDLARRVICFFIHALIFLGDDRSSCGGAVKHTQTSGVGQTDGATNRTKDTRRNKVRVGERDRHLDIGHAIEDGSFQSQTLDAAHSHP